MSPAGFVPRRSRAVRGAAAAVLILTVLLAGCGAAGPAQETARTASASPTSTASALTPGAPQPFTVPPGWKAVSSLGLQFAVPRDWPVQGALDCGPVPVTDEWLALMSDQLLAQSATDRLTSTCHELIVEGESYRQRQRPTHPAA